ncbi:glycoside hydrolase family 3 C-terminal domain-containing protein [Tuanshanicoccus lijuaniae]|uniref:beta-glucosidase n=1 Tax=Aerococcaceae bacterium zg-1292 TaxID=2774330 RepID=UPI0019365648|nr:glycoside hydrolase family 3 C-terminal domain-containing protein [Aerococcaceae bacterium zg-1292]QQA37085.1 glycoside hydrolase family 3 C-terminal domain-containing protein [Aerococcaceae bacterium zg-1292]
MFNKKCKLTDEQISAKAEGYLSKMSLKNKVMFLSGNWKMLRDSIKYKRTYNPVPIESHGNRKLKISPIAFTDGPRGVVMGNSTCFPVSIARAASFNRELEREIGEAIGKEARAQGANYFAGVCINLLMHPAGGRAQESYGEDPYLVGEMGAKLVAGVQKHNVMACAKHYAVNNMENRRFYVDVDCSERTLREVYLPHFKKCIDEGCASLMGSYNRFRGVQASESKHLLTTILRDEWGFEGFTITDFIFALRDGSKAIEAGMDMEMPIPVHFGLELKRAVEQGKLDEKVIDQAVLRVLKTQLIFENTEDPMEYNKSLVSCEEHIALAKKAAEESMVLLKNSNNVLPLPSNLKKLLVIGHLAVQANTGDHGSSNVYPKYVVTALQGIQKVLGEKTEVIHVNEDELDKIETIAPNCDAVIVIAGNDYNDEGEYVMPDSDINSPALMAQGYFNNGNKLIGMLMSKVANKSNNTSYTSDDGKPVGGDRKSLSLRQAEINAIRLAGKLNKNTVVALVSGSMILTNEWEDSVSSVLYSWYSGMEGGSALASILFGDVNPSGKLPFSIPKKEKHLSEIDFFKANNIYYEYDHGYRKLDRDGHRPAYPFGYGLSYTKYAYGNVCAMTQCNKVLIEVPVKNIGNRDGSEIVQVYVSVPNSKVERHIKELKGFSRVELQAGEEKNVVIEIPFEELKYYDENSNSWILEHTEYIFLVGPSADERGLKSFKLEI